MEDKLKELQEYIESGWIDGGEYGMSPHEVDRLFKELSQLITTQEEVVEKFVRKILDKFIDPHDKLMVLEELIQLQRKQ